MVRESSLNTSLAHLTSRSMANPLVECFRSDKTALFSLGVLAAVLVLALAADLVTPDPHSISLENRLAAPSIAHVFGTDHLGRDIMGRIIHGTRIVVQIALGVLLVAGVIGTFLGALAGFYGGGIDTLMMRGIDVLMCFPAILLSLAIVAALGAGLQNAIIAASIYQIASYARLARGQMLSAREQLYVESARAIGVPAWRIVFRHIMPSIVGPLIVQASFNTASAIITVAALGFFGLGAQPPTADWGLMIYEARPYFQLTPHAIVFPGIALFLVSFALNDIGETLRDALDPRLRTAMRVI